MSINKKLIRKIFRNSVFTRDNFKCKCCGSDDNLDAHHITDRTLMPRGGYVIANGITLCSVCHLKAEYFHSNGESLPDFSPEDLYKKINSSYEIAVKMSL